MYSHASLNHVYRTVWNHALGAMVAVPENATRQVGGAAGASSHGRPDVCSAPLALALAVALAWGAVPGRAHANPEGGVAIQGQASITSNGNQLLVTTQNAAGANYSAINWQSFSIPSGSSTYFQQPSAASTVINRVVTSAPSLIFGTLGSNGNVVLVNQSGITVGAGAVVDTAGFTASALRMSDADALAGRMRFGDGTAGGNVSVQGSILARSGDVVLLAGAIDTSKDALIQAPNGNTILAAGQQIEITGRGLEGIALQVQAPADSVVNLGTLKGDAVGIFAGTLKHSGAIQVNAVTTDGGKVYLMASDRLEVDGAVQALALAQRGGSILASAKEVRIGSTAVLDASGALGGGEVLVGGGYQGRDARLGNAQNTDVAAGAQLKADALVRGDGGTVVVWSDDTTRYLGSLSAQGGVEGGNGGHAEVSGKQYLDFQGLADLRAANGTRGSLLLDPTNWTIGDGLSDVGGSNSVMSTAILLSTLNTADLTLAADQDITLGYINLNKIGSSASTLTLNAGHDIVFNSNIDVSQISSASSALGVNFNAGNSIQSTGYYGASISSNGGNISLVASAGSIGSGAGISFNSSSNAVGGNAGNVTVSAGSTVNLGSINASGKNGTISNQNAAGAGGAVTITAGGSGQSYLRNINAAGGTAYGGSASIGAGGAIQINANHDLSMNNPVVTNGAISVVSAGVLSACPDGCISIGSASSVPTSISLSAAGVTYNGIPTFISSGNVSVSISGSGAYVFDGTSFQASSVSISLANGSLSQASGFTVGTLAVSAGGSIDLSNSGNTVSNFSASSSTGSVNLKNGVAVNISGITTATGITVDNTGAIVTTGALKATGGPVTLTAHSPITIGAGGISASGTVTLSAPTAGPTSNIVINGTIQSTGGNVNMTAANNLVQNSGVIAAGGITASASGAMTFGPNGYSSGNPVSYSDASGTVNPPLVPLSALTSTGATVADFLDQFLAALDQQQTFSDDPFDPRNRSRDALVVEGQICTP